MFFFKRKALLILFTITLGLVILNSNNVGISLLSNHPAITVFAAPENTNNTPVITHGIASGDITNESAVVWSRSNREALMHVEYDTNLNFSQPQSINSATLTNQTTDYTAHVKLEGLSPDTLYYYRVWFSIPPSSQANNNYSLFSDTLHYLAPNQYRLLSQQILVVRSIVVKSIKEDILSSRRRKKYRLISLLQMVI